MTHATNNFRRLNFVRFIAIPLLVLGLPIAAKAQETTGTIAGNERHLRRRRCGFNG
jgi:hypothetical protein